MAFLKKQTTPLVEIYHKLFEIKNIRVWVKLDYQNHPHIQGNKLHKLELNLAQLKQQQKTSLLTFGGAYSNHIAATAAAAKALNVDAIGIIRGDELETQYEKWSSTLKLAKHNGMKLQFVSRAEYRQRHNETYLNALKAQYPNCYILPEGGTNLLAVKGFQYLMNDIQTQNPNWTHLYTAVGTGGTLAGLSYYSSQIPSSPSCSEINRKIIGISTIKNGGYLENEIKQYIRQIYKDEHGSDLQTNSICHWTLLTQYHHGGYAKQSKQLKTFINQFESTHNIPLDPIYTGKMFYAFFEELAAGNIAENSQVILYHSGGLQGNTSNN